MESEAAVDPADGAGEREEDAVGRDGQRVLVSGSDGGHGGGFEQGDADHRPAPPHDPDALDRLLQKLLHRVALQVRPPVRQRQVRRAPHHGQVLSLPRGTNHTYLL